MEVLAIILVIALAVTYGLRFVGCPDAVFDAIVVLALVLLLLGVV